MLERNAQRQTELAPPGATPTLDTLPRRLADFATLGEALDYAAKGRRGLNFHDARGTLTRAYPFASCARTRSPMRAASSRSASSPATASRWSPKPGPSSPPASSERSMPAPGRCRCRCRPASAAAKPMSSSSGCSSKAAIPRCFSIRPNSPISARRRRQSAGVDVPRLGIAGRGRARRRRASRGRPGRHRLSSIFERLDPLPARRRGHTPRAARQSPLARLRPQGERDRPRHLVAALVSRHGPGRLPAVAGRDADVGRLSEDRGFRPPARSPGST